MKTVIYLLIVITSVSLFSCGKGTVDVENESYKPKIVIQGFLMPHQKVEKIKITRNFRINEDLTSTSLIPEVNTTTVAITDLQNNKVYPLTFHNPGPNNRLEDYYWEYNGSDLNIEYGRSYKLDITSIIEGKELSASATTTVPKEGFAIDNINYTSLSYRQKDENDQLMNFVLTFNRAPGTTFYVTTIQALNASKHNFIYDNPYSKEDSVDVEEDIVDWGYTYEWTQDTPESAGQTSIDMFWIDFWFYTDYQLTIMACDKNYKEFLQTYNDVQEEDGNFHEAKFNIEGDGIGAFGSVVMDSVRVSVLQ